MTPHLKIQCPRYLESSVLWRWSRDMTGGQPAVWVFFSGVLGRRPSYSLPFGRQEAICHQLELHVSIVYLFDQWGWGSFLLGHGVEGCVAGKGSANDSWNCLQPESNHFYRELTIFHFIVWKIFTLIISHDTLRKLTKSDQAGKHYFPIRLLMYVE